MKRFYGMRGQSKSGKDTVAQMICEFAEQQGRGCDTVSLAGPLKTLASKIFEFSDAQLYGPSESRDATDLRYKDKTGVAWVYAYARLRDHGRHWVNDVLARANLPRGMKETDQAVNDLYSWFIHAHLEGKPTARYVLQTLGTEYGREKLHPEVWLRYGWHKLESMSQHGVITDIRFVNEAKFFSEHGVEIWRVMRPGATGESAMTAGVANHKSEMDQKSYDIMQYDTHELENDGTLDDLRERVTALLQKGD